MLVPRENLQFLQFLQKHNVDITHWPPADRTYLLTGGTIDLCINLWPVASAPKYALMAVSPPILEHLAKMNPKADMVDFKVEGMDEKQLRVHRFALKALAQWLTALCSAKPFDLKAPTFLSKVALRHIAHQIHLPLCYTSTLTHSFVDNVIKPGGPSWHVTELVKSCTGMDDPLLGALAEKLAQKLGGRNGYENDKMVFLLAMEEHAMLRVAVEQLRSGGVKYKREHGELGVGEGGTSERPILIE